MSKQVKEDGPAWEPQTPAEQQNTAGKRKRMTPKHGKAENNNSKTPDMKMKGTDNIGTSNRMGRKKMKRHRPKVVNENKPIKPKTPAPKTPKPRIQVKKKVIKKSVKQSCRQKLEFNEESSIVELKDVVKPTPNPSIQVKKKVRKRGVKQSCRQELEFNEESSMLKDVKPDFGIAEGSIVFKKKRKMRKKLSLEKFIRLVGMIDEKSCNCESTMLNITWIHLKRKRSRMAYTRRQHLSDEFMSDEFMNVLPYKDDAVQEALADFAIQKMKSLCMGGDRSEEMVNQLCCIGGDRSEEMVNQLVVVDPSDGDRSEEMVNQLVVVDPSHQIRQVNQLVAVDPSHQIRQVNQLVAVDPRHQIRRLVVLGPKNPYANNVVDENMELVVLAPRHRRRKVDIDEETTRVWNLYVRGVEDIEEIENDKKYNKTCLDEERELFIGRVDAFISTMFLLSGDRRFTRWKGSVVDSVVGVFLTQNVSDNLSSNAFMDLAARYPPPPLTEQNGGDAIGEIDYIVHEPDSPNSEECIEIDSLFSMTNAMPVKIDEPSSTTKDVPVDTDASSSKTKAMPKRKNNKHTINNGNANWDDLRKRYSDSNSIKRGEHNADTVDWEAVREASLGELAKVIESRGMNNQLAGRIKNFLDLLVRDHGSIDLEWLRNVPPLKAKSYLMSISGLGLKSTECVRLLSLYQPSFPIDVNVGRVLVRLGWVKLQPLPEGLSIHLLNDYPELSEVQEYIWPRICTRDEQTLYEFHCYMNIFSKAFCTKTQPNCKACPMRAECKHYASALASSRPSLEGSQAKTNTSEPNIVFNQERMVMVPIDSEHARGNHCEPILEFPTSPEPAITEPEEDTEDFGITDPEEDTEDFVITEPLGGDIEDFGGEFEMQTIILNMNEMPENLPPSILEYDNDSISRALVSQIPQFAQIPLPKIKNKMRLRTEHTVYELPDSHPLLTMFQRRDPKDACPYLLAIWPTDLCEDSKNACDSQRASTSSSIVQYTENEKNVKGTILIPCRTANKGRFPLNGTYFQINEVFADHDSSQEPIDVPRKWIWNLQTRTLYCGTTITSICRGMTLKDIVYCFRKGYICIRGFDLKSRRPRILMERFHLCKSRRRVDQ